MIPPAFEYYAPKSVGEAIGLLSSLGDEAKLLAGGHSLLPMMKLRFAPPGAPDRPQPHCRAAWHPRERARDHRRHDGRERADRLQAAAGKVPLLPEAAKLIADPQVRNRGTIGGDIAHGDPGNDHPAIAMALDATFVLQGPAGERQVEADGLLPRHLHDGLGRERDPHRNSGGGLCRWHRSAYQKLKRKTGDWATAAPPWCCA